MIDKMGVKCVLRWVNVDANKRDHPRAVLITLRKALEGLDGRTMTKWKIQCMALKVNHRRFALAPRQIG